MRNVGLGILALAVGVAGAVVPVLPGWIFGVFGFLLLGSAIPPIRRLMSNLIVRSGKMIDRCIARPSAHRLLVRTLAMPSMRCALEPSARWKLINHAARRASHQNDDRDDDTENSSIAPNPR